MIIDTHPGLNEETLLSIAVSDSLIVVMRPDQQDYQGTSVTVQVARKLNVPNMVVLVNKAPASLNLDDVKKRVSETYKCPVIAVIPHSDDLMTLASAGVFAMRYPEHTVARLYRQIADQLILAS